MKPQELTREIVEEALCEKEPSYRTDFDDFAFDCHSASLELVRSGLLGEGGPNLRVARGTCIGVPGQHSWVVLGNPYDPHATIVDITLWSYDKTAPSVYVRTTPGGQFRHRPMGWKFLFHTNRPYSRGGEPVILEQHNLSPEARQFLNILGPLDVAGWAGLWSHTGMLGWPSREILEAFLDQRESLRGLVPVDIVGMLTDRNPENLYW